MKRKFIDVSIIIVNYNTPALTSQCIDSIILKTTGVAYEIIVVDNSVDDGEFLDLESLVKLKANVLIKAKENNGFGSANNLGCANASGKYFLFLNSDTILINNAIKIMFDLAESNNKIGIVGGNLYSIDGRPAHSFIKMEYNLAGAKKTLLSTSNSIRNKFFKRKDFNYSSSVMYIDGFVTGADLLISKNAFRKIGGFDEHIFMYGEDALLCSKCKKNLGLKIAVSPFSKITHLEGQSDNSIFSMTKITSWVEGTYFYFYKQYGRVDAMKYLFAARHCFRQKRFLLFVFCSKDKVRNYNSFCKAINSKIDNLR